MLEASLSEAGVWGLSNLELSEFPDTGRGVRSLSALRRGDPILELPPSVLWTSARALADPTLGPVLAALSPALPVDDVLAVFLLFVKSRVDGYDLEREHVAVLPRTYSSSIFFTDAELAVCSGSSLHAVTQRLQQQVHDDHVALVARLFSTRPDLFPPDAFSLAEVRIYILILFYFLFFSCL